MSRDEVRQLVAKTAEKYGIGGHRYGWDGHDLHIAGLHGREVVSFKVLALAKDGLYQVGAIFRIMQGAKPL